MNELSPETKAWIAEAAAGDGPSVQDRKRVRAGLAAQLGAAAFAPGALGAAESALGSGASLGAQSTPVASSAPAAGLGASAKLLLAMGAAGVIGVGSAALFWARAPEQEGRREAKSAEARTSRLEPVVTAHTEPTVTPLDPEPASAGAGATPAPEVGARPVKRRKRAKRPRAAAAPANSSLARELELLGQAQSALLAADFSGALAAAKSHRSEYPQGVLSQEREGIELLARCGLGGGKAEAEAFLERAGGSPLSERIRKACKLK